jgi:ParB/RepB/Spo0J family partition protein
MAKKPPPAPPPNAPAATTTTAVTEVPIADIVPSPTNPRRRFDEGKLAELAESIRAKGVLQPVLVRPASTGRPDLGTEISFLTALLPSAADALVAAGLKTLGDVLERARARFPEQCRKKLADGVYAAARSIPGIQAVDARYLSGLFAHLGGDGDPVTYELVAGERRFRAAKLAGLQTIPASVRQLSDLEVLEIQVVENEQREDVAALERADGYARLVEEHQVTVEDLAQRVGKSVSTIRELLKLRQLPETARTALDAGEISTSVAGLIASRPSPAMREKVADYALTFRESWQLGQREKQLPSYRDVKDLQGKRGRA